MQIYRLFEIVYILLHEKLVTAKSLAERFDVSQRTVYRDIDILSLSGIPVYTEKGKGGGISLLPDFVLNKSLLSEQEQIEILSALHGLSKVKSGDTEKVLKKIQAIFQKTAANWLAVDFSYWNNSNSELFDSFKTAILERRIAGFDYYSAYGKKTHTKTRRRIEPVQLWFKSRAWYIKGYCLSRNDVRTFKLSRINNLKISDEHFAERDLSTICKAEGHEKQEQQITSIKLRIQPEMADRVFDEFNEKQVTVQGDGSFIVSVEWPEDDWVYGTLLSYGEYLEVLEPENIRKALINKIRETLKKYL